MFLLRDNLFNIYYWLIDIEFTQSTALKLMPEWNLSNTCIFSVSHTLLGLGTWEVHLGAILKSDINNKKHKNPVNKAAQIDHRKDTCLQYEN